jgi:hypothetical protein
MRGTTPARSSAGRHTVARYSSPANGITAADIRNRPPGQTGGPPHGASVRLGRRGTVEAP